MKLIDILVRELPKRGGWPDEAVEIWQDYDGLIRPGKFGWHHDQIAEDHRRKHEDAHVKINRKQYEAALAASKAELDSKELPAIIGRFVPIGNNTCGRMPFNVLTRVASDYMPPAWEGIIEGGKRYHVIEKAWRFEPVEWNGEGLPPVGCECEYNTRVHKMKHVGGGVYKALDDPIIRNVRIVFVHGEQIAAIYTHNNNLITIDGPKYLRPIRSEEDKKRDEVGLALYHAINWNAEGGLVSPSRMEDYKKAYDAIAAGKIPGIRID